MLTTLERCAWVRTQLLRSIVAAPVAGPSRQVDHLVRWPDSNAVTQPVLTGFGLHRVDGRGGQGPSRAILATCDGQVVAIEGCSALHSVLSRPSTKREAVGKEGDLELRAASRHIPAHATHTEIK